MLHALAGRPDQLQIGEYPWYVAVTNDVQDHLETSSIEQESSGISEEQVERIRQGLSFRYPHLAATRTPSKMTATDRKGREKDREAAEKTVEPPAVLRKWRKPAFLTPEISGKEYGNVMHTVMQYIAYERCREEEGIREEIKRLTERGFLTSEQAEVVDSQKLLRFFGSEIGRKLCSGIPYLREFKFSVLDSGGNYDPALKGEQVLLQGVVDCALLEKDGITIIDFKTDYVIEETIPAVIARYRPQVDTYAEALLRIYEQPVKERYLYLFHLNKFVAI